MTRVYLGDASSEERAALRWMLLDLQMEVVGEAADWPGVSAGAPALQPDLLLLDFDLLRAGGRDVLAGLRRTCPQAVVVLLAGQSDVSQLAGLSPAADFLISKDDPPDRVADGLRRIAVGMAHQRRPAGEPPPPGQPHPPAVRL